MRLWARKLLAELRLLRFAESGVAAVEFALILPFMLLLYVGSIEVSAVIGMDRKLQSLTGTIGDLVSRTDTTLKATDLADYFKAASGIMTPNPTTGLVQIVTSVEVKSDGTTSVDWSRKYVNGVVSAGPYSKGSSYTLPNAMKDVAKGKFFVIVSEGRYDYQPLYGFAFDQTVNLYRQNFFMPRFGESIKLP